jgi:hypothetical protein
MDNKDNPMNKTQKAIKTFVACENRKSETGY